MEAEQKPPRPPLPQSRPRESLGTYPNHGSTKTFRELQRTHDTAHRYVNFGLNADGRNSLNEATESYKMGLQLLDEALNIDCELLKNCSGDQRDHAKQMQQKMLKTKQQIAFRLQTIETEQQDAARAQVNFISILYLCIIFCCCCNFCYCCVCLYLSLHSLDLHYKLYFITFKIKLSQNYH